MTGPAEGGLRVVVERDRCQGYANCLDAAPDIFDLDEHDIAVTGTDRYPMARRPDLERAVDRCPAKALRLEEINEEITDGPPA